MTVNVRVLETLKIVRFVWRLYTTHATKHDCPHEYKHNFKPYQVTMCGKKIKLDYRLWDDDEPTDRRIHYCLTCRRLTRDYVDPATLR